MRYIYRNPAGRALAANPEDWKGSSYRRHQSGMRRAVEVESEWTASEGGWHLPEWMCYRQPGLSSPVPKSEGPAGTLNGIETLLWP
jgi:hypothetical protein